MGGRKAKPLSEPCGSVAITIAVPVKAKPAKRQRVEATPPQMPVISLLDDNDVLPPASKRATPKVHITPVNAEAPPDSAPEARDA